MASTDGSGLKEAPIQLVRNMFAVQTEDGRTMMRVEAPLVKRFDDDTSTYEVFPEGLAVYGYDSLGRMESIIIADEAKHVKMKGWRRDEGETWSAFGNVVLHNVIEQQTLETDTIYWDHSTGEVFTDCYVRMYSPSGFMQGYGMRTDDRVKNAILHNPFDSYGITTQDTLTVVLDSVNFIGPLPKTNSNFEGNLLTSQPVTENL